MNGREFWVLKRLSNEGLEASLGELLGAGARVEARIVAHLAEVEARRLHLLAGYSSLYDYCRKRLSLSDYEAFARIAAARVARKYPVVFEMLERRELHLTAICEVREFLCDQNHEQLLAEVSGKTKLQIRDLLARRFPQADIPASLKKLPALDPLSPGRYRLLLTLSAEQKEKLELARDLLSHANPTGDFAVVVERALDELVSRLESRRFGRSRVRPIRDAACTHDPAVAEKAAAAQGVATRSADSLNNNELNAPTPNDNELNARALNDNEPSARTLNDNELNARTPNDNELNADTLNDNELNGGASSAGGRRAADGPSAEGQGAKLLREAPHVSGDPSRPTARRCHIPHEARRQVRTRDGVCCAFVSENGRRCEARGFLQFHHRHAWARGGPDTIDNLALFCHAHNRLLAERDFGRAHVDAVISRQSAGRSSTR